MSKIHLRIPHQVAREDHSRPTCCGQEWADSYVVLPKSMTDDRSKTTCKHCLKISADPEKLRKRAAKDLAGDIAIHDGERYWALRKMKMEIKRWKLTQDQVIEIWNEAAVLAVMES